MRDEINDARFMFPNCDDELLILFAGVVRKFGRERERKYLPVLAAAERALERRERLYRAAGLVYEVI